MYCEYALHHCIVRCLFFCPSPQGFAFFYEHIARSLLQLTDSTMQGMIMSNNALEKLWVCQCPQISDVTLILLSEYCTGLRVLDVNGCARVTDDGLLAVLSQTRTFTDHVLLRIMKLSICLTGLE
jgi:hypothetical protein